MPDQQFYCNKSFNVYAEILNTEKYKADMIVNLLEKENIKKAFDFKFEREESYSLLLPVINFYLKKHIHNLRKLGNIKIRDSLLDFMLRPIFTYIICISYSRYKYFQYIYSLENAAEKFTVEERDRHTSSIFVSSEEFFNNIFTNLALSDHLDKEFFNPQNTSDENPIYPNLHKDLIKTPESTPLTFYQKILDANVFRKPHRLVFIVFDHINSLIEHKLLFKNIYGLGLFSNILFSLILFIKSFLKKNIINDFMDKRDREFWNDQEDIKVEQDFFKLIDSILNFLLPKSIQSDFYNIYISALSSKKIRPGEIYFDSMAYHYDMKNFHHALCRENGSEVAYVQHGCGYATFLPYLTEMSEYQADYFVVWGKEKPPYNTCKFFSLPSPMLSRLKDKHKFATNVLLFIGTTVNPLWDGILYPHPACFRDYLLSKINFFQSIDTNIFSSALYKLHPNSSYTKFNEEKFMSEILPNLALINKNECVNKYLFTCKLLVMDNYGTSFYKAIAANTPVIIFLGLPMFKLLPTAKKIFDKLKEVGILYDSAEEAAAFINTNWARIDKWWFSKSVQEARKNFCEFYAQADNNYFWIWLKKIILL
jgi:putative transferase (TIGR04331 family)